MLLYDYFQFSRTGIKNFTTQSLASVAYQVNTLASSMLNLLSEQDDELSRLCSGT